MAGCVWSIGNYGVRISEMGLGVSSIGVYETAVPGWSDLIVKLYSIKWSSMSLGDCYCSLSSKVAKIERNSITIQNAILVLCNKHCPIVWFAKGGSRRISPATSAIVATSVRTKIVSLSVSWARIKPIEPIEPIEWVRNIHHQQLCKGLPRLLSFVE